MKGSGPIRVWRRTRARILERDGFRCTRILDDRTMERCTATTLLEVHHTEAGNALLVPDDELVTLCRKHHRGF